MLAQFHTTNPAIHHMPVHLENNSYLGSAHGRVVGFDKVFIRLCGGSDGFPLMRNIMSVSVIDTFMREVFIGASYFSGRFRQRNLVGSSLVKEVGVDQVFDGSEHSTFSRCILNVIGLGALLKVMGVAAFWVVAEVHKYFPLSDRLVVEKNEGNSVGQELPVPPIPVTVILGSQSPFPADVRVFFKRNLDVFPKVVRVVKACGRIFNNIIKLEHMNTNRAQYGACQPCYGGNVCPS